jgi:hypothetical protein
MMLSVSISKRMGPLIDFPLKQINTGYEGAASKILEGRRSM